MFEHLKKHVPTKSFLQRATWKPPQWEGTTLPPAIIIERLDHNKNPKYAKAVVNPRLPQVRNRRNGVVKATDVKIRMERLVLLAIIGGVVGWENVTKEDGSPMPFPTIGEEKNDEGVMMVRQLLAALGEEAEADFIAFAFSEDSFIDDSEDDEDDEAVVPLPKP